MSNYLQQLKQAYRQGFNHGMDTGVQLMDDFISMSLHDQEVMGKTRVLNSSSINKIFDTVQSWTTISAERSISKMWKLIVSVRRWMRRSGISTMKKLIRLRNDILTRRISDTANPERGGNDWRSPGRTVPDVMTPRHMQPQDQLKRKSR